MNREQIKKIEEKEILDIFLKSTYGKEYINEEITFSETPDFIIKNEGFEITRLTDEKGKNDYKAYIDLCNVLENKLKQKYGYDYSVFLIPKHTNIKYKKIKKQVEKEIIKNVSLNINSTKIQYDFCKDYNVRNNILSQNFNYIEIEKSKYGTYGGPFLEMKRFSKLYAKAIKSKEEIFINKTDIKCNLIVYCFDDTFFHEAKILEYKIKNDKSKIFKNIYIIFHDIKENIQKIIKM